MKYLANLGGSVFIKAADGMSPIHVACQNGNLDIVQYLVENFKVNINEKDFNGATPLHFASINGNSDLVAFLLSHGAKILVDKFGILTFFCLLILFCDCEIVEKAIALCMTAHLEDILK